MRTFLNDTEHRAVSLLTLAKFSAQEHNRNITINKSIRRSQTSGETSLFKETSAITLHEDPIRFSRDMSQIVENAPSCNVKESFRQFLDPGSDVDDFQNVTVSSTSNDASLTKSS